MAQTGASLQEGSHTRREPAPTVPKREQIIWKLPGVFDEPFVLQWGEQKRIYVLIYSVILENDRLKVTPALFLCLYNHRILIVCFNSIV